MNDLKTQKKLTILFDLQKFVDNKQLAKLIVDTEDQYAKNLSDDDLSLVNAAGDASAENNQKKDEDNRL